jgi:hypothetical protein
LLLAVRPLLRVAISSREGEDAATVWKDASELCPITVGDDGVAFDEQGGHSQMGAAGLVAVERLKLLLFHVITVAITQPEYAATVGQKSDKHGLLTSGQHHITHLRLPG